MTALKSLRAQLASALEAPLLRIDRWTDEAATRRMVKAVTERHDGPGQPPDHATISDAVNDFRRTGRLEEWRDIKRVCFGAALQLPDGWCVLSDSDLRDRLIRLVDGQETRKRLKCYQALLSSYWAFRWDTADENAKAGWMTLRAWLDSTMGVILRNVARVPGWFTTLVAHRNLLGDNPCGRYGRELLEGDESEFQAVVRALGIPSGSWVPEEAVMAVMQAAAAQSHDKFQAILPRLLDIATDETGVTRSQALRRRCVALLVSRYAKMPDRPEHMHLRDVAVNVIGNPWLHRASWDSAIVDSRGHPDNDAREMVYGWLKRRLITDFFELLSDDGMGDRRRLDYWLRFEPFIDDMWFALGMNSRGRRGEEFEDFRKRARGRLLDLEGTTADNNAFIMRMGDHVAVEFGETGNALYMFRWNNLPPAVLQKLLSGKERIDVTIHEMKSSDRAQLKKPHRDSPVAIESWEQKFDAEICPLLGRRPEERPAFLPELELLLKEYHADAEDRRPMGGALWLFADNSHPGFSSKVRALGFSYRASRGWWKE